MAMSQLKVCKGLLARVIALLPLPVIELITGDIAQRAALFPLSVGRIIRLHVAEIWELELEL